MELNDRKELEQSYFEFKKKFGAEVESLKGSTPTLIAVSKTHSIEKIKVLYDLGHRDFGENYAQELAGKVEAARTLGLGEIRWHFIGPLQSNKSRVLSEVTLLHTLASQSLAKAIAKDRVGKAGPLECLIQVNIDEEPQKSGVLPGELKFFLKELEKFSDAIHVRGLMCIPKVGGDPSGAFQKMRDLGSKFFSERSAVLSMGMSEDWQTALKFGSTHVRVGSAIFGSRGL